MTCFRMPDGTTLHKWCVENGKSYDKMWKLLDAGATVEEVVYGKPVKVGNSRLYCRGKPLSKLCGGSRTKRYQRIMNWCYKGFDLEYAVWREIQDNGDFIGGNNGKTDKI